MTRIGIIGNSHASALMAAYAARPEQWPNLHPEFTVFPGWNAPDVEIANGILRPRSGAAGRSTLGDLSAGLNLAQFDAVVISGVGVFAARNEHVEKGRHPLGRALPLAWGAEGITTGQRLISKAMFEDYLLEFIKSTGAFRTLEMVAREFDGPILVQPVPRPAEPVLEDSEWFVRRRFGDDAAEAYEEIAIQIDAAIAALVEGLPARVSLLPQVTGRTQSGFLRSDLGRKLDPWHANSRHGAAVLKQIERRFAAASATSLAPAT